jgi:RHS repeat-associated protein
MAKIVEKTGATVNSTRKFVWSGQEKLEFRDAADAVTMRILPQGQHNGTTPYFFTRDHLGSVREVLSGGGTVVARYDYDPYGRSTTLLGTTATDMNFTGLYRHSKSNLDLAVYRAYDPDLGRWLNRDPIEEADGTNLYAYVGNRPIASVDPLGLQARNPVQALYDLLRHSAGSAATHSGMAEIEKGLADCRRIPHSRCGERKCCVISVLARRVGPNIIGRDGSGTVYNRPCSEVNPEFIYQAGWELHVRKIDW